MKLKEVRTISILSFVWVLLLFSIGFLISYVKGFYLPDVLFVEGALFLICSVLTNVDDDPRASFFRGNEISAAQNLIKMRTNKGKKSSLISKGFIKEGMLSSSAIFASFIIIYLSIKL